MHIGHYISGGAHIGLLGWALFGGMFSPKPQDINVAQVSIISASDFEMMQAQFAPPLAMDDMPQQPDSAPSDEAPDVTIAQDATVDPSPVPEAIEQPDDPIVPIAPEPLDIPIPDVADQAVEMPVPAEDIPQTMPTAGDDKPIDANRVAPVPIAPETPASDVADIVQDQAIATPDTTEVVQAEEKATAPEAASSAIITEAVETGTGAPSASFRPPSRPKRPEAPKPEPDTPEPAEVAETADPEPKATEDDAAVMAALEAALAASVPSAPALTANEMSGLRLAVQQCWVVDVGSEAANITVTVGMALDQEGRVEQGSINLIEASSGSANAVEIAFQVARRAILRCQKDGFELPLDKYDQWRNIEMVFNPENMRTR